MKINNRPFVSISISILATSLNTSKGIGHTANKEPSILQAHTIYLMHIIKRAQGSHNRQEEHDEDEDDLYKAKSSYPFVDGIGQ
jgi:hypothetical protein